MMGQGMMVVRQLKNIFSTPDLEEELFEFFL